MWKVTFENTYYKWQQFRWIISPFIFGQHTAFVELLTRHYGRYNKKVIDIGSRCSPYTSSLQGLVVGVDLPAQEACHLGFSPITVKKFAQNDHHFPIFARGEQLPFKSQAFDVALMIEVIEHIPQDREALAEVQRVLKPGGILLLTTPNGETFPLPSKHHVRHYTAIFLKNLMGTFFKIERFWHLFPRGKLWEESIKSVRSMLQKNDFWAIASHVILVLFYWPFTLTLLLLGKTKDTTTFFVIARKIS